MADMREKLEKLIYQRQDCGLVHNSKGQDFVTYNLDLANHLIANGVTIQKWIPVTERLPEQNEDVLVYTITNDVRKAHCYGDRQWFAEDGVWRWVTHWMPLPQPPKGSADNG